MIHRSMELDIDIHHLVPDSRKSSVYIFCHPSMRRLATGIVNYCAGVTEIEDKHMKLKRHASSCPQRFVEFCDGIEWGKFPDGFPNLFLSDLNKIAGKDVIYLGSFHSPSVIFEQLSVLYAIPRYLARSFSFILPYFPTGTMERIDMEGQIATAKTLARLLSCIPLTARGPPQVVIFDIHALQERFYFSESVIPRLLSAVPLLLEAISNLPYKDQVLFAFPDDGAHKRFRHFFPGENTVICNKVREGDRKIVTLKEGNPQGKHLVIIDDLVQTGGTLIECCKVLKNHGAVSVSAYVTHAVFPNNSWKKFTDPQDRLATFWITDSIPHALDICEHEPFKLLSLATVIGKTLVSEDLTTS